MSPSGKLFQERIPRVSCTREQAERIVDLTIEYYDQAVMAYRVSDDVLIKHRKQ